MNKNSGNKSKGSILLYLTLLIMQPLYANIWQVNITITQAGTDSSSAKTQALQKAKQQSLLKIINKLSPRPLVSKEEDFLISLKTRNLIRSFTVVSEKISAKTYKGKFKITFSKNKLTKLCRNKFSIELITKAFPPILVLPIEQQNTNFSHAKNRWLSYLKENLKNTSLLQLQLLQEHPNITPQDAIINHVKLLKFIKAKHNAIPKISGILVLHHRFIKARQRSMHSFFIDYKGNVINFPAMQENITALSLWEKYNEKINNLLIKYLKSKYQALTSDINLLTLVINKIPLKQIQEIENLINSHFAVKTKLRKIKMEKSYYSFKATTSQIQSMVEAIRNLGYEANYKEKVVTIQKKDYIGDLHD